MDGRLPPNVSSVFGPRPVSAAGIALIKEFEGLRLQAYSCAAGVCTIGWGHTLTAKPGQRITIEMAERLLADDVKQAAAAVEKHARVPLNDNQFAALASFVFNVGPTNFYNSTLLRLLNRGWYEQVPVQLMRWTRANGEMQGGLTRRRKAEAALWNTSVVLEPNRP